MIVMFERSPTACAVRWASSHSSVLILSGQRTGADLVVEDLGRGAGQRPQPGVLQPRQVVGQRLAEPSAPSVTSSAVNPWMWMSGHRVLHRLGDVDVVVAVEVGVDAALQAHLGGAAVHGLADAAGDLVEREEVRRAPQVERQRALREAAEPALERAHVGVVDVAVATNVTTSPTVVRRSSSATSATAATSGPRAPNSVTISSSPTSWPASSRRRAPRATAPRAAGPRRHQELRRRRRRRSTRRSSGGRSARPRRRRRRSRRPGDCSGQTAPGSSRPRPSASERSSTGKRRSPGRASAPGRSANSG